MSPSDMISVIVATCFVAFMTSAILCLLCYEAMLLLSEQVGELTFRVLVDDLGRGQLL